VSAGRPAPTAETRSVARGSATLFWAQIAGNSGLFVALVLVTRALGPSGRGTIAFLTVAAILLARVARVGVGEATTVFAAQRRASPPVLLANLLLAAGGASIVASAVVCGLLVAVPEARPDGFGAPELALLALGAIASAFADAGYAFVLGCSRFRLHAAVTAVSAWLFALVVATVWAVTGLTVATAALAWIAVQALKGLALLGLSARTVGLARPNVALLLESVRFGIRGWFGTVFDSLNDRLDQILTAYLATQATLGVYAVAVNASEILFYLPAAAATAILPLAARAHPGDRPHHVVGAFRSVALLTLAAVAAAAVVGPLLLPLVFGAPFDASIAPFLLLLPGTAGYLALAVFSNALMASGAPGRSSVGAIVSVVVMVVLDLVLVPRYGAEGAAAAASTGYVVGGVSSLLLFRGLGPFPWRSLVVPRREDGALVRALVEPLARITRSPRAASSGGAPLLAPEVEPRATALDQDASR
jgi:O-antigen/teichoic acid export membrane protein